MSRISPGALTGRASALRGLLQARGQGQVGVARRAVEASCRGEAAATLELLRRSTARAGAMDPEKPRVLAGANDGHGNARPDERGHQDEVRHGDEQADQGQARAQADAGGGSAEALRGALILHRRGRVRRRRTEGAECSGNIDGVHDWTPDLNLHPPRILPAPRSRKRKRATQGTLAAVTRAAKKTGATGPPERSRAAPARS